LSIRGPASKKHPGKNHQGGGSGINGDWLKRGRGKTIAWGDLASPPHGKTGDSKSCCDLFGIQEERGRARPCPTDAGTNDNSRKKLFFVDKNSGKGWEGDEREIEWLV